MTKQFCDICGLEITSSYNLSKNGHVISIKTEITKEMDICGKCYHNIVEYIESNYYEIRLSEQ